MKHIIFTLLLVALLSCDRAPSNKDVVWMYINEPHCSFRWDTCTDDPVRKRRKAVEEYLEREDDMEVYRVKIEEGALQREVCLAMHCDSGNKLSVEIEEKHIPKLESIGFELEGS